MIYFDNAASTKPEQEVLDLFVRLSNEHYGNPSSVHQFGFEAGKLADKAREDILNALGVNGTHKCLFCSSATEANNLAIKGIAKKYENRGKRIITDNGEHPSVLNACRQMADVFGFDLAVLPINEEGKVDPKVLESAMDKNVVLVSIMAVNNEVGAINDINALSKVVHQYPKAFFHVDATQAIGKENLDYRGVDLLSFSAHKFGGLKGNGALIYKKTISFLPLLSGGEQEYGLRSGTLDAPGYCAMALALVNAIKAQKQHREYVGQINTFLKEELLKTGEVSINSPEDGTPFVLNFSLIHKKGSVVTEALSQQEIYVSSVSACSSKHEKVSDILLAMNKSEPDAANSIRISFNHHNTLEEAKRFIEAFKTIISEVNDR